MHEFTTARAAAEFLVGQLRGCCDRIEIAGSLRRRSPIVKDIEIVAIGLQGTEPVPGQLFGATREFDCLERKLERIAAGKHPSIVRPKVHAGRTAPWGARFKKLWVTHVRTTFAVDLFQTTPETWGPTLVIRTGPADFSRLLVTKRGDGGAMPDWMRQHEGRLEWWMVDDEGSEGGQWTPVETPDEASYFATLGVPLWEPHERTEARLVAWLRNQGTQPTRRSSGGDKALYAPFGTGARPSVSSVH